MTAVRANHVKDVDDEAAPPGAFEFDEGEAGMFYKCPCGCVRTGYLRFRQTDPQQRPSWVWNGDRERPTLEPSVHHLIAGETHWHGWLRDGVWTSC
jgi:hypothetical protein